MKSFGSLFLVLLFAVSNCYSDDSSEDKNVALEDAVDEPAGVLGDWFKSVEKVAKTGSEGGVDALKDWTEDMKEKSDSGVGALKDWAEDMKEKSDSGMGSLKGLAEGFGDRFVKAKAKVEEAGEKMKESVGDAALNVKEEVESAASKVSKHAKEASETMMKMFRF